MKQTALYLALAAALPLAGAAFAVERGLALAETRRARAAAFAELDDALKLAAKNPGSFGRATPAAAAGESALKALAQDLAAQRQLAIGFLSESERDTEGGRRERQVIVRLVQPPHPSLVLFLGDLEAQGARVREIHVRPSAGRTHHYEEAELVVARVNAPE